MWVNDTNILSDRKILKNVRVLAIWITTQTMFNASNVLNIVLNGMLMVSEQSRPRILYQHNCHNHFERFYSLPSLK